MVGLRHSQADLLGHHLLGLVSWGAVRVHNCGGLIMCLILLAEGSSPFLHCSTKLHALGWGSTRIALACNIGTLLSFLVLRVMLQPFGLWALWRSRPLWPSAPLFALSFSSYALFLLLNLFWFRKLVRRAMGSKGDARRAAAPAKSD